MTEDSSDTLKLDVAEGLQPTVAEDHEAERKRSWYIIALIALSLVVLTGVLFWIAGSISGGIREFGSGDTWSQNLGFLFLINVNIVFIMVFAFLVIKNVVRLIVDRRKGILGSRIRTRLVATFVGLSLVPTIFLFLVSRGILSSVLQLWFSPHITTSVDGAVALARYQYRSTEAQARRELVFIAQSYQNAVLSSDAKRLPDRIKESLERKREEYSLRSIVILDSSGVLVAGAYDPDRPEQPPQVTKDTYAEVQGVSRIVHAEQTPAGEVIRAYSRVELPATLASQGSADSALLITTRDISPEFARILAGVLDAFQAYRELKTFRIPLASSSLLTLIVVTLMVIFAAIWVGFYLARTLTVPIQMLAEGTQAVARGNLEYRIPETGRDEVSLLVRSFNTMTEDLKRITDELVRRRRYMETILASVDVGVLTVDAEMRVTTFNRVAAEMLGKKSSEVSLGCALEEVVPKDVSHQLTLLLKELSSSGQRSVTGAVSLHLRGKTKHLHIVLAQLRGESESSLGTVILLDDLTELVSAQRIAAWQEVAKRMAHEFKNPLTPIQLSAQRIQRRLTGGQDKLSENDSTIIREGTDTIVQQVEVLKNLVDEFSRFARMPQPMLKPVDLSELCRGAVSLFQQAHSDIEFELAVADGVGPVQADGEQLTRVFVNMFENAVAAIREYQSRATDETERKGKVTVSILPARDRLVVEIMDSGTGFGDIDRARLFEPYFSTKKGGTGLGLAIVQAILSDHHANVQVRDNVPHGAVFILDFPAP